MMFSSRETDEIRSESLNGGRMAHFFPIDFCLISVVTNSPARPARADAVLLYGLNGLVRDALIADEIQEVERGEIQTFLSVDFHRFADDSVQNSDVQRRMSRIDGRNQRFRLPFVDQFLFLFFGQAFLDRSRLAKAPQPNHRQNEKDFERDVIKWCMFERF